MNTPRSACPDPAALAELSLEKVFSSQAGEALLAHVADCPHCQVVLAEDAADVSSEVLAPISPELRQSVTGLVASRSRSGRWIPFAVAAALLLVLSLWHEKGASSSQTGIPRKPPVARTDASRPEPSWIQLPDVQVEAPRVEAPRSQTPPSGPEPLRVEEAHAEPQRPEVTLVETLQVVEAPKPEKVESPRVEVSRPAPAKPAGLMSDYESLAWGDGALLRLGDPVTCSRQKSVLTLFPICLPAPPSGKAHAPDFLDLAEGLRRGLVTVDGDGGVLITNLSARPVLATAGEVLEGGYQDQVLAVDAIIPAHGEMDVPSYCVEHYRNSGLVSTFRRVSLMADPRLRGLLLGADAQERIWDEVAWALQQSRIESPTGAYNALGRDPGMQRKVEALSSALQKSLKSRGHCVGVVAVSGGEILGADFYGDPMLFEARRGILVDAYARAVLLDPPVAGALSKGDVQAWLMRVLAQGAERGSGPADPAVLLRRTLDQVSSEIWSRSAKGRALVHVSVQRFSSVPLPGRKEARAREDRQPHEEVWSPDGPQGPSAPPPNPADGVIPVEVPQAPVVPPAAPAP